MTTIETIVSGRHDGDMIVVAKTDLEALARFVDSALGFEQRVIDYDDPDDS